MVEDGKLVYVGTCGSGLSEQTIAELFKKFEVLKNPDEALFDIKKHLKGREAVWLLPKLVCEVKFAEWTPSKVMRHPVFKRLREDKNIPFEQNQRRRQMYPQKKKAQIQSFSLKWKD